MKASEWVCPERLPRCAFAKLQRSKAKVLAYAGSRRDVVLKTLSGLALSGVEESKDLFWSFSSINFCYKMSRQRIVIFSRQKLLCLFGFSFAKKLMNKFAVSRYVFNIGYPFSYVFLNSNARNANLNRTIG